MLAISNEPHALRAEELAIFLSHKKRLREPKKIKTPDDIHNIYDSLRDKTGIIFYKDYWNRGNEKIPSGNHIDLWLGSRTMGGHGFLDFDYNSIRLHLCQIFGSCSDERKSREIWFWGIK